MLSHSNQIAKSTRLTALSWLLLIGLLVLLFLLDIFLGSVAIPLNEAWEAIFNSEEANAVWVNILYKIRLPKAITAIVAGTALAISGLQMQTLFRNPLAGPSVLGITAGASLGVAFLVLSGSTATAIYTVNQLGIGGSWAVVVASTLGAALVLSIILLVSFRVKNNVVLLIIGLMVANITIAIVGIWQYFSSPELLKDFLMWTFGSLGGVVGDHLGLMCTVVIIGFLGSLFIAKWLNMLLLGEQYASSMGLTIKHARIAIIIITSLLAGTITGFCGPIGFIGIAVPHLSRAVFRTSDHYILLPSTALLGAITLLGCDIIAQLPNMTTVLPINSVTALLGSPVVIWVIVKRRKLKLAKKHNADQYQEQITPVNSSLRSHQLIANQLSIGYSNRELAQKLDLEINSGELITLLGPNGAGKSTLLRTISGLQQALAGEVLIDQDQLTQMHARHLAQKLSLVLTDRDFFGDLSVYSLVAMGRYPHTGWFGNMTSEDWQMVQWALNAVGMLHFADRSIHFLSDGEKQKVLIARALAQDTPFLFLDEPTAHLDLPNRIEIFKLLKQLAHEHHKAILMTTHELDWAMKMADKAWILSASGKFIADSPTALLRNNTIQQVFNLPDNWINELKAQQQV